MPQIDLYVPCRLPWQAQVVKQAQRFNVLVKGRRAGGTTLAADLAIDAMLDRQPVGWFSATYKLLAEAQREIVRMIEPAIVKRQVSEHRLEILGGGTLEMWSLEGDISARGRKYKRVVIDEAAFVADMRDKWEQQILPSLADLQGDAWFVSSPNGTNFFRRLYERGTDPEWTTWAAWQLPTWCNPLIAQSEIDAARAGSDESNFRQEWAAEFVVRSGAVFPSFRRDRHVRDIQADPNLPIYLGIDFGFLHFAAVAFQLPSNGEVHVIGEYEGTEIRTQNALHAIASLPYGNGKPFGERIARIGCDPTGIGRNLQTGMTDVQLVRRAFPNIPVVFSTQPEHRNPEWGAARIRDLLLSTDGTIRLYIAADCRKVIRTMENLIYPAHREGTEEKQTPVKDGVHDHLFDAMRYGFINAGVFGMTGARSARMSWL